MSWTSVNTARSGVQLLSSLMREVDGQGNGNKKISTYELNRFLEKNGDGAELSEAMTRLHRYTQKSSVARYSPTLTQSNKALGRAMRYIARGDKNKTGRLSGAEKAALAPTWQAIVAFAAAYRGQKVEDIVAPAAD